MLYGAGTMNREPGVVGPGQGFLNTAAFAHALPEPVAKALGRNIHVGNRRPLAEGDPAALTVRHAAGVAEPVGRRYPSAEEMLGNPVPLVVPPAPTPDAPDGDDPLPPDGLRMVGSLPGGGGVWERVRGDEPPAEAAA